jgi:hypothetical protein
MEDFLQPLKRTKNTTAEMKENPIRLAFFTIEVKKIKCSVTAAGLKIPQQIAPILSPTTSRNRSKAIWQAWPQCSSRTSLVELVQVRKNIIIGISRKQHPTAHQ